MGVVTDLDDRWWIWVTADLTGPPGRVEVRDRVSIRAGRVNLCSNLLVPTTGVQGKRDPCPQGETDTRTGSSTDSWVPFRRRGTSNCTSSTT